MFKFSELGITPTLMDENKLKLVGEKIKIDKILNKEIVIHGYKMKDSKYTEKCLCLQILLGDTKRVIFTGSKKLIDLISQVGEEKFPISTTIIREDDDSFTFT